MRTLLPFLVLLIAVTVGRAQEMVVDQNPAPLAESEASPAAPLPAGTPDKEISRFMDRYLWFLPQAAGHRASLGIAVFVAGAFLIMLAARMANLDGVTFGRGAAMSAIVLLMVLAEVAFVPAILPVIAAVVMVDLVAWFALVRGFLGGDFFNGIVMLVCCVMVFLVAVLGFEVAGTLLQRSELLA